MNFSRPMTEEAWQTREAQHQSLMRSLPAQPARHSAFLDTFGSPTFAACSVSSINSSSEHGEYQPRIHASADAEQEQQEQHWYATANPNRYEPHG